MPARRFAFDYGWVVVVLAALAMTATMLPGRTHGLGLITEPLLADLGIERTLFGRINLVTCLLGTVFCLPAGWMRRSLRHSHRHLLHGHSGARDFRHRHGDGPHGGGGVTLWLVLVRGVGQKRPVDQIVSTWRPSANGFRGRRLGRRHGGLRRSAHIRVHGQRRLAGLGRGKIRLADGLEPTRLDLVARYGAAQFASKAGIRRPGRTTPTILRCPCPPTCRQSTFPSARRFARRPFWVFAVGSGERSTLSTSGRRLTRCSTSRYLKSTAGSMRTRYHQRDGNARRHRPAPNLVGGRSESAAVEIGWLLGLRAGDAGDRSHLLSAGGDQHGLDVVCRGASASRGDW